MPSPQDERAKVFVSYSRKDGRWLKRLQVHLKDLERRGLVELWDDTKLQTGTQWRDEINKALDSACAAILLISADFIASDFIADNELPPLLARAEENGVVILPLILSPSRFEKIESLSRFMTVNPPSEPLIGLSKAKQERYLVKLSEDVLRAIEKAQKKPTGTSAAGVRQLASADTNILPATRSAKRIQAEKRKVERRDVEKAPSEPSAKLIKVEQGPTTAADPAGKLVLELVDVYGAYLAEQVEIRLRNQTGHSIAMRVEATGQLIIEGLTNGIYHIEVAPLSYLPVGGHNVFINAGGAAAKRLSFIINPRKVTAAQFIQYSALSEDARRILENSKSVKGYEGQSGASLYAALDDTSKANLLNVIAGAKVAPLSNASTVLLYLHELVEISSDTCWARAAKELEILLKNSVAGGLFYKDNDSAMLPPKGYKVKGNYKASSKYGRLNLTFSVGHNECLAQLSLEEVGAKGHVFQVLPLPATLKSEHPYYMHDILVSHQKIEPGYRFILN